MSNKIFTDLLEKITFGISNKEDKIVKIYNYVQNVPWRNINSREAMDIINNNAGTCSGKHKLLQQLYTLMDIEVVELICEHRFIDLSLDLPFQLSSFLTTHSFIDYHNFIKIKNTNNEWIYVDATWDLPLAKLGFPVTINWDGNSNTLLGVNPINIVEVEDSVKFKQDKINKMEISQVENRTKFILMLSDYLDNYRKQLIKN